MPLRVIAGEARGRLLKTPPKTLTRPTADKVREALFQMLSAQGIQPESVLDLYSGSGAMGIEALSRGAVHCDFVEADARACAVIRQNLLATGFKERGHVLNLPVTRAISRLEGIYDLVVADPPYEYDRAEVELGSIISRGLVTDGGIIVIEHSKRYAWPDSMAGCRKLTSRQYGDSAITFYQYDE